MFPLVTTPSGKVVEMDPNGNWNSNKVVKLMSMITIQTLTQFSPLKKQHTSNIPNKNTVMVAQ